MRWALRQGHSANFNPRSPHGERRHTEKGGAIILVISIHAPRTGSDDAEVFAKRVIKHFNPRSPHGERPIRFKRQTIANDFNPRSPHGERQKMSDDFNLDIPISIHAPRTGSDAYHIELSEREKISIHAPRTGSDTRKRRDDD